MKISNEINTLTEEYLFFIKKSSAKIETSTFADDDLIKILTYEGEWSALASEHLLNLARRYGSFMLKNALALSIALQIEDGELGF